MKIYKDKELAIGKECYKCKAKEEVRYYREYDLFLCEKCYKKERYYYSIKNTEVNSWKITRKNVKRIK